MTPRLPKPFTPATCDVRDLDGFMLNTERLMSSELMALATGDEFKAAVTLWCRAWKQVPAASLPNDDRILAAFSGAGERWPQVREMALRGFELCSDGRLYHRTLSLDAIKAFAKKQNYLEIKDSNLSRKQRERAERAEIFKLLKEQGITPDWNTSTRDLRALVTPPVTRDEHVTVTVNTGQGQGQGQGQYSKKEEEKEEPVREGSHARPSNGKANGHSVPPPKGTRWPPDQVVPPDWRQAAGMKRAEHGLAIIDVDLAAEQFKNFWIAKSGQGATKVDWHLTWINWALRTENPRYAKSSAHENFAAGAHLAATANRR
jgi:Protein of unknown function (DUF1376)